MQWRLGGMNYLDFDEDEGEGVGEGNVAEGLETAPDLLGWGDDTDADSGEAAFETFVYCLKTEDHLAEQRRELLSQRVGAWRCWLTDDLCDPEGEADG